MKKEECYQLLVMMVILMGYHLIIIMIKRIIVFGKASFVTDLEECKRIGSAIWWKFGTDKNELEEELARSLSRVLCVKIEIEHMTGKLVNES